MITTAVISFREFLEAFLIVGVFLGISRKLNIKKEFEIGLAAIIGVVISLLLATGTYLFGDQVRGVLTEKNAELLEGYLMIFSGIFIAYVVFSLHDVINRSRAGTLIKAQQKLQEKVFDFSLFSTIVFLVIREGFEIALFTAGTSLFSVFVQNFIGHRLIFLAFSSPQRDRMGRSDMSPGRHDSNVGCKGDKHTRRSGSCAARRHIDDNRDVGGEHPLDDYPHRIH